MLNFARILSLPRVVIAFVTGLFGVYQYVDDATDFVRERLVEIDAKRRLARVDSINLESYQPLWNFSIGLG